MQKTVLIIIKLLKIHYSLQWSKLSILKILNAKTKIQILTLVNMAHTSQTLEPAELQERAFEYGRQLQLVAPKLANKYSYLKSGKSEGLQDIGTSVNKVDSLVQSEVLNTADKLLIRFLDFLGLE